MRRLIDIALDWLAEASALVVAALIIFAHVAIRVAAILIVLALFLFAIHSIVNIQWGAMI